MVLSAAVTDADSAGGPIAFGVLAFIVAVLVGVGRRK
jgi:MYXO-CTERM domain-containing protein